MIFELSIARRVRWYIVFVDLKLPSLIAGPCKNFPIACIVRQQVPCDIVAHPTMWAAGVLLALLAGARKVGFGLVMFFCVGI